MLMDLIEALRRSSATLRPSARLSKKVTIGTALACSTPPGVRWHLFDLKAESALGAFVPFREYSALGVNRGRSR